MLGLIVVLVATVALVVGVVAVIMFFDLTFGGGERVVADREISDERWRPPYVRGADLRSWTRFMAMRMVALAVGDAADATTARKLVAKLTDGSDRAMLPSSSRGREARQVACPETGQGVMGISAPEVTELADYLRGALPPAEVRRIHEMSRTNADLIAQDSRLAGGGAPCSLQGDDCVCKAYPARPLGCRPLHAVAIAQELGLSDAGPMDGESTPWAAHTETIGRGIAEGLARGLDAAGLDGRLYELHSALVTALDNPNAAERWARGEDVFGACLLRQPEFRQRPSLVL